MKFNGMTNNGYTIKELNNFDRVLRTGNNLIIERNGKTCAHGYYPSKTDKEAKTAQQIAQDIISDFHKAAATGKKGFDQYKAEYGDLYETESECKSEFRYFTRAYEGLKRLNPEAYAALSN